MKKIGFAFGMALLALTALTEPSGGPVATMNLVNFVRSSLDPRTRRDDIVDALAGEKQKSVRRDKKADFTPVRTTFKMTGQIVPGNITLICQELAASGWIDPETDPNKWQKLFSGVNSNVKIVWTGKVGIGSLKALFEMMEDEGFITHDSHSLNIILRSHFVDYEDNHIGDFRGSKYTSKSDSVIDTCREKLELQL